MNVDSIREVKEAIRHMPADMGRELSRDLKALAEVAAEKAEGAEPPKPVEREQPVVGW